MSLLFSPNSFSNITIHMWNCSAASTNNQQISKALFCAPVSTQEYALQCKEFNNRSNESNLSLQIESISSSSWHICCICLTSWLRSSEHNGISEAWHSQDNDFLKYSNYWIILDAVDTMYFGQNWNNFIWFCPHPPITNRTKINK